MFLRDNNRWGSSAEIRHFYGFEAKIYQIIYIMIVRLKNVLSLFSVFMACGLFSFPVMVLADPGVEQLTEENVRAFIMKTAEITSGQSASMPDQEIIDYLNAHMDKGARFKSTMEYVIPDQPVEKTSLSLSKKDFMESVMTAKHAVSSYETALEIQSIQITGDGTKAVVKTVSRDQGSMNIEVEGGAFESLPMQGRSSCNQIISLSDDGIIQMYSAQCSTKLEFASY